MCRPKGKMSLPRQRMLILYYQRLDLISRFFKWPTRIHYSLLVFLDCCRNQVHPHIKDAFYYYIHLSQKSQHKDKQRKRNKLQKMGNNTWHEFPKKCIITQERMREAESVRIGIWKEEDAYVIWTSLPVIHIDFIYRTCHRNSYCHCLIRSTCCYNKEIR